MGLSLGDLMWQSRLTAPADEPFCKTSKPSHSELKSLIGKDCLTYHAKPGPEIREFGIEDREVRAIGSCSFGQKFCRNADSRVVCQFRRSAAPVDKTVIPAQNRAVRRRQRDHIVK